MSLLDRLKNRSADMSAVRILGPVLAATPEEYTAEPRLLEEDLSLVLIIVQQAERTRDAEMPMLWELAEAVDALRARRPK
jgi:hypothetical protein